MKFSKAVEGFLISLSADGYSENTIDLYKWGLALVNQRIKDRHLSDITIGDLKMFMAWLQHEYSPNRFGGDNSPLKPASIENVWIAIRSFFNWASIDFDIERPDLTLKRPKYKPRAIAPLSRVEIDALFHQLGKSSKSTKWRNRAILLCLLDAGPRVSELCRAKLHDVNLETGEFEITPFGTGRKTNPRTVFLGRGARKGLWRYLADRESPDNSAPLFISKSGKHTNRYLIRTMLVRLGNRAGVANVGPHRLRHTFAIEYLRNGGDVFTLQRILGHSTLDMVKRYLAIAKTDIKQAHKLASPVDRWGC